MASLIRVLEDGEMYGKLELLASKEETRGIRRALRRAAEILAQRLVAKIQERTPVLTGALRDTIGYRMLPAPQIGFVLTAGEGIEYAWIVHEDLTISHPVHPDHNCGGQAKFMESVMLEEANSITEQWAALIDIQEALS